MRKRKKNKDMIRFSGRRHTKLGILSAAIGIIVIAGFLTISIISGVNKGNGGFALGVIGITLFILALLGFALSYKSYQQKDVFLRFPVIGLILNGFMSIILLVLYILGFGG